MNLFLFIQTVSKASNVALICRNIKCASVNTIARYLTPPCLKIEALHQLTNGGDDCYGKVKRASEFPLSPGAMGLSLQHHSFDFAVVDLGEAVLLLHLVALLLQDASAGGLRLRLQRVKHRGADQQVGEHAEDERQCPDVLLLHPRRRRQKGARLQVAPVPPHGPLREA